MIDNEIKVGFSTFVKDGADPFGAVREIAPDGKSGLVIYVENAGEFSVPFEAVQKVHFDKVILNPKYLDQRLRDAIGHAHDAEDA